VTRRRLRVILNPRSGHLPKPRELLAALALLEQRGWTVERRRTSGPQDARRLAAAAAAAELDAVLACGGDGTINEVVNGLAHSQTALAVLPAGTVNVWAREVGISRRPLDAVRLVDEGERRRIDLGRVGERYFLLLASVGSDAAAVGAVSPEAKRRFGRYALLFAGVRDFHRRRTLALRIDGEGEPLEGTFVAAIAGNTRLYAGVLEATAQARLDDGLIDLCALRGAGWRGLLPHLVRTGLHRHLGTAGVEYRQAARLTLTSPEPLPVQVDGEYAGQSTLLEITAEPQALTVIVPRGLRSPLFGDG